MSKGNEEHVHTESGIPLTEDGMFCPRCKEIGDELTYHMKAYSVATGFYGMDGSMWVWDGKDGTRVWPRKERH